MSLLVVLFNVLLVLQPNIMPLSLLLHMGIILVVVPLPE